MSSNMQGADAATSVGILDIEIHQFQQSFDAAQIFSVLNRLLNRHNLNLDQIGRVDCVDSRAVSVDVASIWQCFGADGNTNLDIHCYAASQQYTINALLNCLHWIDSSAWNGKYGIVMCMNRDSIIVCLLGRYAPLCFDLKSIVSYFAGQPESTPQAFQKALTALCLRCDGCVGNDLLILNTQDAQFYSGLNMQDALKSQEFRSVSDDDKHPRNWLWQLALLAADKGAELDGRKLVLHGEGTAMSTATLVLVRPVAHTGDEMFTLTDMQHLLQLSLQDSKENLSNGGASTAGLVEAITTASPLSPNGRGPNPADVPQTCESVQQTPIRTQPVKVVVTGVAAALPGRDGSVFNPGVNNIQRIINGECFISTIPDYVKDAMLEKNVCIQSKNKDGSLSSTPITTYAETINVCGALGQVDLTSYGIAESIISTMDSAVQVAIAAGLEALRDAGLVSGTGPGTTGWQLPSHMQDCTGVVYATSFPALDTAIAEVTKFFAAKSVSVAGASVLVEKLRRRLQSHRGEELSADSEAALSQLELLVTELSTSEAVPQPYQFDRKFLFRVLVLGNAQLAQIIKARGPNMQTNAACAGATQAIALAYDMIQVGRAERVVVIAGDSASSDTLMPWLGNGFRILGAATLCAQPAEAARPFQAQRSGMILGSGGIGMVLESETAALQRLPGLTHASQTAVLLSADSIASTGADAFDGSAGPARAAPSIRCRLLGTQLSNSAYHGAAMDKVHIAQELERFITAMEAEHGITRSELAQHGVYFSHETGTHASPASSCAANEIYGLRKVFGEHLKDLLILNTKGFTGHPMGVSFEDVVAVDVLATGRVPPVAHFNTPSGAVDPFLGSELKISRGGEYACNYALRFAAGFGSQIALALYGCA